jgi:chromosomal replication initiator protein
VPPRHLTGFEDRMRSRFEWGLITDVQAPDLETRIAILRKKAQSERLLVPDDVLEYIATKVSSNIRELEGALIRVSAFASLNRSTLDISSPRPSCATSSTPTTPTSSPDRHHHRDGAVLPAVGGRPLRFEPIAVGRDRTSDRDVPVPRAHEPVPKIGQLFGNRDHTTVMYAYKKISELMKERRSIYNQVSEITTQLGRVGR